MLTVAVLHSSSHAVRPTPLFLHQRFHPNIKSPTAEKTTNKLAVNMEIEVMLGHRLHSTRGPVVEFRPQRDAQGEQMSCPRSVSIRYREPVYRRHVMRSWHL